MTKYRPPVHMIVAVWVTCGLGIYGINAWYFPAPTTWLLIVPTFLVGLALGVKMWRSFPHLHTSRPGRRARPIIVLMVPVCLSLAVGHGLPALGMRLMGPDSQISATVVRKEQGGRRCRRQVYLAEYWPSRMCVSESEYDRLEQGARVLLDVRQNAFGIFVFSVANETMEPAR